LSLGSSFALETWIPNSQVGTQISLVHELHELFRGLLLHIDLQCGDLRLKPNIIFNLIFGGHIMGIKSVNVMVKFLT